MPSRLRLTTSSGIQWRETSRCRPRQGKRGLSSMITTAGTSKLFAPGSHQLQKGLQAAQNAERIGRTKRRLLRRHFQAITFVFTELLYRLRRRSRSGSPASRAKGHGKLRQVACQFGERVDEPICAAAARTRGSGLPVGEMWKFWSMARLPHSERDFRRPRHQAGLRAQPRRLRPEGESRILSFVELGGREEFHRLERHDFPMLSLLLQLAVDYLAAVDMGPFRY